MGAGLSAEARAPRTRPKEPPFAAAEREAVIISFARAEGVQPRETRLRGLSPRKRAFDLVVAGAALTVLLPPLILTWSAVRLTSKGPGLHWSKRIGRGGREFWMPKFRTMHHGAPSTSRELLVNAKEHITPLGAVLRRWSLDELPQLICILKGDMSFVGPRPLLPDDPAQIARNGFPDALAVRPGLSGLAQVRGRNHVSPRRKARLDAFYARVRSGPYDLEIFVRTFLVLATGRGFM